MGGLKDFIGQSGTRCPSLRTIMLRSVASVLHSKAGTCLGLGLQLEDIGPGQALKTVLDWGSPFRGDSLAE